jgi:predicted transcriptional regulator
MTQERAIETVRSMPHDFNVDELIDRLVVLGKIEEAEKDVEEGKVVPHSEVKKMFDEWMK